MYTEYEEERKFPIRSVLFKMVIIIILIMLLIWILPTSLFNGGSKEIRQNAKKMQDAAITHYQNDKLPKKENKLTLKQMQELKLIGELEYNKKSCDVDKSYVKMTKRSDDYLLKTYLKCGKETKTLESVVGKYDYCTGESVCLKKEEEDENKPSCSFELTGELGVYDWYRSDVKVVLKTKKSTTGAKIKSYGISTKNKAVYNKDDKYTVKKDGKITIYGFVKDSDGKTNTCKVVVMKDTKKPTCELSVISGDKNTDGVYTSSVVVGFSSKKDKLSDIDIYGISKTKEALYNEDTKITINNNGNHTIYGHVKDKAGNVNTCKITINKKATPSTNNSNNNSTINSGYSNSVITNNGGSKKSSSSKSSGGTYKPLTCILKVYRGTKGSNGSYTSNVVISFKNITTHGTKVTGYGIGKSTTYSKNSSYTITTDGKHTVYGYVKDNKGNTAKCSITINKNSTNSSYEYSKYINPTYSSWSAWKELEYSKSNPPVFTKTTLKQVEDLGKKAKYSYKYSVGSSITLSKFNEVNTLTGQVCKGYDYYRVSSTTYAVNSSASWKYVGLVKNNTTPVESVGVKYEYDHLDWNCGTCTTPNIIWRKYTRNYYTVSGKSLKSGNSTVNCSNLVSGKVRVANVLRKIVAYSQKRTITTTYVYKYRYRTRTLLKNGYTDYKYSNSSNDKNLIKNGYKLIGKVTRK